MVRPIAIFVVAAVLTPAGLMAQEVIATRVYSVNNHTYILLSPSTWTQARATAVELGGTLVVLNDSDEESFVFDSFSRFDGVRRNLWIGLYDLDQTENSTNRDERRQEFSWIDGTAPTYTNWSPFEPNNVSSPEPQTWEYYCHIWEPEDPHHPGKWNNLTNKASVFGVVVCGVVEIDSPSVPPPVDSDGDGVPDLLDGCPQDPNKTTPGACGCGQVESELCDLPAANQVVCCASGAGQGLGLVSLIVGWRSLSRRNVSRRRLGRNL